MSERNKALTWRMFEELENQGNTAAIDEIFARDFVNHLPFGELRGTDGAMEFVAMLRRGFPDLHTTVRDQIAEGDRVTTRWTAQGTGAPGA